MSGPLPRRLLMTVDAVGGVWRYAMDLAGALSRNGTQVVFGCLGPPPSPAQMQEADATGELVLLDAPLDWIVSDAGQLRSVPTKIADVAMRTDADLLHLNLPSQAAGLEIELPIVVVSHSCVVTWFRTVRGTDVPPDWAWQRELNQRGFDAADVVVAPSRSHAALLAACYDGLDGIRVVNNAVRPIARAAQYEPFVIAAGRWWDEGKNARTLDAAAARCNLPVWMAGSQRGPNGQYQPIDNATPLGQLSSADVRALIARATAFVSPSIYEPFGLAPLEAASAGLPLVLSDIPTYRELWEGAALFAPPDDAAAFATLLNRLANSAELRAGFGARAAERAATFTLSRQVEAMQAAYAGAIHARVPPKLRARA